MTPPKFYLQRMALLGTALNLLPVTTMAAESDAAGNAVFWNLVIAIIVLAVTLASAALPLAALRQWQGNWRRVALAPLVLLGIWVGVILLSRLTDPGSHRLWPFEVFSWAMLNMIYMVAVMTYKRQIDKAEAERRAAAQSEESVSDQAS